LARKKWKDLSPTTRRLIVVGAIAEGAVKTAVLIDIKRRPADEIRGQKWIWAASMLVNSFGIVPLSYFAFGRRR
jgi:hypothetical protein